MKNRSILVSSAIVLTLSGCAGMEASPPTETHIDANEFVINAPLSLLKSQSNALLKGFKPNSFRDVRGQSPIWSFYSVNFKEENNNSMLLTEICSGDLHDRGNVYKSCVFYESRVTVEENDSSQKIKIKPIKKRTVQGKNAIFFPIDIPSTDINKWYEYVSNQTIYFDLKYNTKYPVEALKANFDRKLDEYRWGNGESDVASKQFINSYELRLSNNASAIIGASFYPYQDGALVQIRVKASSALKTGEMFLDWSSIVQEITEITESAVNG